MELSGNKVKTEKSLKRVTNSYQNLVYLISKQYALYHFMENRHSGSVVERPLCDREVAGSITSQVIPKTLKMVLAALSLGAQH